MTSFGSLDPVLKAYEAGARVFGSAGPVSDAFILSRGAVDLLNGPLGSAKTTSCVKRGLNAARLQPPIRTMTGQYVRRYVLTVFRETYDQLWGATIPSWKKVLNPDLGVGAFTGSSPRPAEHVIEFVDRDGPVQFIARFRAFSDDADPDSLGGFECTDAYLNEMDQLPEKLFTNILGRIGRDPTRGEVGLPDVDGLVYGRVFGDCNAPSPDSWVFRDFWSATKPAGYRLFRQPGGLDEGAENLGAVGRQYYVQQEQANRHRPWWVKIKIHNKPGYNRENDVVFADFEHEDHVSPVEIRVEPNLPVIVGFDGGATPAAALLQEHGGGKVRILHEVVIERGDEIDLARELQRVMGLPRFKGCEFVLNGDPATGTGEDLPNGSFRRRLAEELGMSDDWVRVAETNDPEIRHRAFREAMKQRGGFLVDGVHCPTIVRALNGTFHYHTIRGSKGRGNVVKTPDSHVMEAAEYAGLLLGSERARLRRSALKEQRERRRQEVQQGRTGQRYSPLRRAGP
jgi:hypothetical protein